MRLVSSLAPKRGIMGALIIASTFTLRSSNALGYLGGFENADGYALHPFSAPFDPYLNDHYNAGQYATNNGGPGGSMTAIPVGSGLWTTNLTTNNGYNLASQDDNHTLGGQACCDFRGGNFSNFRAGANNVDGQFGYTLDSLDLNGVAPASINNDRSITMSFYYLGGVGYVGTNPDTFLMHFKDGAGNVGATFGLADNSTLAYGDAGGMHSTSINSQWGSPPHSWIYVRYTFDLAADTYDLGVVTGVPSGVYISDTAPIGSVTNGTVLASGAPLGAGGMSNLTGIDFYVEAETGTQGSTGVFSSNKQLLDDFDFTVSKPIPEPATSSLVLLSMTLAWRRNRAGRFLRG